MALRIGLVQLAVTASKPDNLTRASRLIKEAVSGGAKLVALPECFNSPYGTKYFPQYAEAIPGESTNHLAKLAAENKIFLIGGSIPEKEGDTFYNTCTVYGPDGSLIAKHRKVHLFDIDIPGKIRFQESEILSPGEKLTVFEASDCKIGVGICYDMRFAEMAQTYARAGCKLLMYPGAFNMTTGPAHWELLQRARALDNQVYFATVSPARDENASYVAWGHSTVVNPWGEVISKAGPEEKVIFADIDLNYLDEVRNQIPVTKQRRDHLYKIGGTCNESAERPFVN